jgi:hypothetical protein
MMKLVALGLLTFLTCAFAPTDAVRFNPPPHYREVWRTAEACTGKTADFDKVTWYEMPGNSFSTPDGSSIGWWEGHTITIAHDWKTTDWLIKHEAIHEITRLKHDDRNGKPGPRDTLIWGKQCAAMWGFQPRDTSYVP